MKAKILVIEDEYSIRRSIIKILEIDGFEVIEAEDGHQGLLYAKKQHPDLILCDILMPELDGYLVLTEIRQDSSTATVPFIFLTARSSRKDLRHGMELGADDYLIKPFTRDELLNAVKTQIEKREKLANQYEEKIQHLQETISYSLPHELQTPLSAIFGFSEMLYDQCETLKSDEIKQISRILKHSAERLDKMIQNYVLYTQLEALATNPEELDKIKNEQVIGTKYLVSLVAGQKAEEFHREKDLILDLEDAILQISEKGLLKILTELTDNAFKFSKPGSPVYIKATVENQKYIIEIIDQGIGMTHQQVQHIDAYVQFDRTVYEQQGFGLGLAIVKRLINLYDGQFEITSTAQKSTTATIQLKIKSESDQTLS